ncbi:hypothetical protein JCM11251_007165 [Rhodosporidiobolus azoricus]
MPSFSSLLALSALALPLASAGSHWSHPRAHQRDLETVRYRGVRTLPRSGRRLNKRGGEATVKCLTSKTFALCDGDKCTDMGAVAAGTACVDNAITWDTSSESSPQDSSAATAASVEQEEPVSFSPAAAAPAAEVSVTQKLANNAVVQPSSSSAAAPAKSTSSAPAPTAAAAVNLNVDSSASSSDSASDAFDEDDEECDSDEAEEGEDDEDEECDSDDGDGDQSSSSSSSAWVAPTTSSKSAQTSAAASSPSSSAVANVNLVASQPAPTTTQAPAPTTTTTTTAAAQTSSAASGGGSSSSSGGWVQGKATFFYQGGAAGACGKVHSDSDKVIALGMNRYGSASNTAPDCGRQIEIKNEATGQSVVATVADACPGCDDSHLDLSVGAFDAIGKQSQGVVPISWKFIS